MRKTRYDKGGGEGVKKKSKNSVTYFTNDLLSLSDHATNKSKLKPWTLSKNPVDTEVY